jgi:hypothetical protein
MSDSATWVAVGLAIGAASLALGAALVVLLVVVRGRRSSYAEVEQLLRDSLEPTEGVRGDLAAALEERAPRPHRAASSARSARPSTSTRSSRGRSRRRALTGVDAG